jgi:hypothetical protein
MIVQPLADGLAAPKFHDGRGILRHVFDTDLMRLAAGESAP